MNRLRREILFHVLLPIFIGGIIYIAFRSEDLLMFSWFKSLGLHKWVGLIRNTIGKIKAPGFVKYSLPDAIWIYSLTYSMLLIWHNKKGFQKYFWITIGIILSLGSELLQIFGIIEGTFDLIDLFACIAASLLAFLLFYNLRSIDQLQLKKNKTI